MKLHPDVQALSDVMHELELLLRDQGQAHWADNVLRCVRSIDQSDAYGLRSFLALFGGMGSLNDVALWRDGVMLDAENDRLRGLTSKAWDVASRLVREIQ
jgi:hypothetical protein